MSYGTFEVNPDATNSRGIHHIKRERSNRLPHFLPSIFVCLVTLSTFSGCSKNINSLGTPPLTTEFYTGSFSVSAEPLLGRTVDLSFTLETMEDVLAENITFYLPHGIMLVKGNLTWKGDVKKGEKIVHTISIKAASEGSWRIRVWVDNDVCPGFSRFFYVYINSTADSGTMSNHPVPTQNPQKSDNKGG